MLLLSVIAVAVIGIALIAMGEDIGTDMSFRTFGHLVSHITLIIIVMLLLSHTADIHSKLNLSNLVRRSICYAFITCNHSFVDIDLSRA